MKLTSDEKVAILKRHAGDPGLHSYALCPACGTMIFRSTDKDKPEDIEVHEEATAQAQCSRCQEAFRRAPEVVKWVMAVLGYQKRKTDNE